MRIAAFLLILVMFSTCIVTGRLAKYVTTASGGDAARVAKFDVTEEGLYEGAFFTHISPYSAEKPFSPVHVIEVVNNGSEVAVECIVKLENMTNNLPNLKYEMVGKDENGNTVGTYDAPSQTYSGILPKGRIYIHVQTIWEEDDPFYAEKVDWVRILVSAQQVD